MNVEYQEDILEKNIFKEELDNLKTAVENKEIEPEEALFKKSVANALQPIYKLTDFPLGGVVLHYDHEHSSNMPQKLDVFPKEMKVDTLPYIVLQIGEKMFSIAPDIGFKVDNIYMNKEGLYITASMNTILGKISKTTSKNKTDELGAYLWRLYSEGEKGWYLGSTVKEIPKNTQKIFLEKFNALNK